MTLFICHLVLVSVKLCSSNNNNNNSGGIRVAFPTRLGRDSRPGIPNDRLNGTHRCSMQGWRAAGANPDVPWWGSLCDCDYRTSRFHLFFHLLLSEV